MRRSARIILAPGYVEASLAGWHALAGWPAGRVVIPARDGAATFVMDRSPGI
jgi:hypothetical protein